MLRRHFREMRDAAARNKRQIMAEVNGGAQDGAAGGDGGGGSGRGGEESSNNGASTSPAPLPRSSPGRQQQPSYDSPSSVQRPSVPSNAIERVGSGRDTAQIGGMAGSCTNGMSMSQRVVSLGKVC